MRTGRQRKTLAGVVAVSLIALVAAIAQQKGTQDAGTLDKDAAAKAFPKPGYSPYAGRNFPTRVFLGDTHLHTSASMDAGAFGCRLGPKDAYRFAKGEEVTSSTGQRVKLSRPLDFLVVTDYSDNMGFFPDLFAGKPELLADPQGRRWYEMIQSGKGADAAMEIIVAFTSGKISKDLIYAPGTRAYRSAWHGIINAAEDANDPGRFTAFIGYEWTSPLTRREARVSDIPRKARAVVGMRRSGKTCFLHQCLRDRLDAGTQREALVYFSFEDERLAGMEATQLGWVLEEYFVRCPGSATADRCRSSWTKSKS